MRLGPFTGLSSESRVRADINVGAGLLVSTYVPFFLLKIYQSLNSTGPSGRQLAAARLKQVNAGLVGYPM